MKLFRIAVCGALLAAGSLATGQTKPGDTGCRRALRFCSRSTDVASRPPHRRGDARWTMDDTVRICHAQTTALTRYHSLPLIARHGPPRMAASWRFTAMGMGTPTFFFLSGGWVTGNRSGRELFPNRAERDLRIASSRWNWRS